MKATNVQVANATHGSVRLPNKSARTRATAVAHGGTHDTNISRTAMKEAQASQMQTADKNQLRSNSAASLSVPRVAKREGRVS